MKKIVILLIFTFSPIAFAQKTTVTTFLHFTGKIDKYPIVMTIAIENGNDSIVGEYYYSKSGKDNSIYIKGTFIGEEIKLEETTYEVSRTGNVPKKTGAFSLRLNSLYKLSGSWQSEKKDKQFEVTLTCLENLPTFNPRNFTYKLNKYIGKSKDNSEDLSNYTLINQLEVFNSTKEKVQTLTGFNEVIYDPKGKIELEDINFDGFLDLKIPIYFPNRTKYDGSFLYFIYDKTKNLFIRNQKLEELEYLAFDQKNKEFVKLKADGSGNETYLYYKWENNTFYLIRKIEIFEDSGKTLYTEYQIKNYKSVKVKEYQK